MSENHKERVVVIGASGIGKYHAQWWDALGVEVSAFAGSTPESVKATAEKLGDLFGFNGRGYSDVGEMLAAETPTFVDVCSPPHLHLRHTRLGLEAGCHVLCEKPLYYNADEPLDAQLAAAREVLEFAAVRGRRLALCTQYPIMAGLCLEKQKASTGEQRPKRFHGHVASPVKVTDLPPARIWMDLAPHMLGALQTIAPDGTIRWNTLRTAFAGDMAQAEFALEADSDVIACRITAEKRREEPTHIRRLVLDEVGYDMDDVRDESGVLQTRIRRGDEEWLIPNVLCQTIRMFKDKKPLMSANRALVNHEWSLGILERA